jgi:hypothetical protein
MSSAEAGGDKAKWIDGIVPTLRNSFPLIKGLVWFDVNKEADWRISSSQASEAAYIRMANDPYLNPQQSGDKFTKSAKNLPPNPNPLPDISTGADFGLRIRNATVWNVKTQSKRESKISEAQLAANNRANAQLSTGPRTEAGKRIASLKAVKTALAGRTVLLPTDDATGLRLTKRPRTAIIEDERVDRYNCFRYSTTTVRHC